jgi:hypothetical protein
MQRGGCRVRFDSVLAVILLAVPASAQTLQAHGAIQLAHFPPLSHAELPLYPPIARLAHISGTVEIQAVVEKGVVVGAEVESIEISSSNSPPLTEEGKKKVGLYLSNPSLANLKTWQFQSEDRAKFLVKYVYRIEGEPTSSLETPRVEFDLPSVKITATPIKPTCFDCGAPIGGTRDH